VPVIYSGLFFDLMMCDNKMICIGLSDVVTARRPKIRHPYQRAKKPRPYPGSPGYHRKNRGAKHGRKNS